MSNEIIAYTTASKIYADKGVACNATWHRYCKKAVLLSSHGSAPFTKVCDADGVESHLAKQAAGVYQACHDVKKGFDGWFIFTCDDTWVNIKALQAYIDCFDPSAPSMHGQRLNRDGITFPSGGAGMLMSARTLVRFLEKPFPVPVALRYGWSDVRFGIQAEQMGIDIVHNSGFHSQPWDEMTRMSDVLGAFTWHHITSKTMIALDMLEQL